ncbi:DUF692 domain-containing protein [Pseudomaricurvus alkylphenolicus]|uniref:DUF692 domain-containing protein n=1 Tax=Pseudomaricurvus alkylphenolicus TaxID=1306991 RepID=UPI001F109003|nr:DUF692 domain-containing protein [Pseudomaricurvus alkylphenolicus]
MSRSMATTDHNPREALGWVGVGLRHPHYRDALSETSDVNIDTRIDFVEVHAENFFAAGGMSAAILQEVSERYALSLHSTSLGLGSAAGVNDAYLSKLNALIERTNPVLISDHACFTWSHFDGHSVHAGDLLPLEYTRQNLQLMVDNVDRAQQCLGRRILVENVSAYLEFERTSLSETEFLVELAERSQCGLLVDLNNLLVNAHNFSAVDPLNAAKQWLEKIPSCLIGEFHLAGYAPVQAPDLIIDDHSRAVSEACWQLYEYAIWRNGPMATLIEWDNDLPSWNELVAEAAKARRIIDAKQNSLEVTTHV